MTLSKLTTVLFGVLLAVSLAISTAFAQSNDNKAKVRQHQVGSMIKLHQPPPQDSVTIQLIDSVTASQNQNRIKSRVKGHSVKKKARSFDREAFMAELLKRGNSPELQPPVGIHTQAGQGSRVVVYVKNRSSQKLTKLSITAAGLPKGWQVQPESRSIKELPAGHQQTAAFELTAPTKQSRNIDFKLASENGTTVGWTARITLPKSATAKPKKFQLHRNSPNPFNPTTTISYSLPQTMNVQLRVYNILGQEVATLVDSEQQAGVQYVSWDASRLASGTYIYRIIAEGADGQQFVSEKKMVLIK